MTQTSRKIIADGIAAYFGGTYNPDERCWRYGSLTPFGLGTVRKAYPKKLNDADFTAGMTPGRNMGAFMVVYLMSDNEGRQDISGAPVSDGQRNITAGGMKRILYRCELDCFHMSQTDYTEDAVDDVDQLLEQIKQQVRLDRTLGGICTEAGESRFGIQSQVGRPGLDAKGRTGINFRVTFEVMTQFVA